jgi:hypothetical protein
MQTFLPYDDFVKSAIVLDSSRLQKQRIEVFQILQALTNPEKYGWQNHPAKCMWRGHTNALTEYGLQIHIECNVRGIADNENIGERIAAFKTPRPSHTPYWFGIKEFHWSHKRNLLFKNPEHYRMLFRANAPKNKPPYVWPHFADEWGEVKVRGQTAVRLNRYKTPRIIFNKLTDFAGNHIIVKTTDHSGKRVHHLLEVK